MLVSLRKLSCEHNVDEVRGFDYSNKVPSVTVIICLKSIKESKTPHLAMASAGCVFCQIEKLIYPRMNSYVKYHSTRCVGFTAVLTK